VDQIVCLGDVTTLGPRPKAVIEILGELDCPCIMGNHDKFLLDPDLVHTYGKALPKVVASVDWSRSCHSAVELGFLLGFERRREVPLGHNSTLQLFHGSPRSRLVSLLRNQNAAGRLDE
jgi:hypothetical protein